MSDDVLKTIFSALVPSEAGHIGWRLTSADFGANLLVFQKGAGKVVTLKVPVVTAPTCGGNTAIDARIILLHTRSKNHEPNEVTALASWVKHRLEDWQKKQRKPVHSISREGKHRLHINFEAPCDYKCIFCDDHLCNEQLAQSEISGVIADLEKTEGLNKTKKVTISCNEPFSSPGFWDLLDCLESNGIREVEVFTTGLPLASVGILGKLKVHRSLCVDIPLYGVNARTHDLVTGRKGSFKQVMTALRGLTASKIPTTIHTIALRQNIAELDQLANEVFAEHGSKLFVRHLIPMSSDEHRYASLMPSYGDVGLLSSRNIVFIEFPPCVVPESQPAEVRLKRETRSTRKVRIRACDKCRHKGTCGGIYEMYIKVYGKM